MAAPAFDALRPVLADLNRSTWPTLAALNELARQRSIANARGAPIRFIAAGADEPALHYELRIAERGEILTRDNWHDLLNALQWLAFPRLKAAISEQHAHRLASGGEAAARSRSVARDVLTLFDENGLIVVSSDPTLLALMREFRWKALFVERRADIARAMRFFLAGHGVLEKALQPYVGLTAKALLFEVDEAALGATPAKMTATADCMAAAWLANPANLASTRNLHPLPLLGIPGWDARNELPAFYDDTHYFRPGYSRDARGAA